ncbi:MAG: outer membrane lipoprotein chaperone LolA [Burkholderiaceae bacterium]
MNIRKTFSGLVLLASLWSVAGAVRADGLSEMATFLRDVRSAQASFTQVVTSPQRQGESAARSKTSSGRFEFLRPNRFRFEYTKPFEQSIVADGDTLYLFDVDLGQVTARKQQEVMGSTPAALIAAGTDIKSLASVFELTSAPAKEGVEWVDARPRGNEGQLQSVRVGFRQGQLVALEIQDSLGQKSVLTFSDWKSNVPLKPEQFRFVPPPGVDVIRP